MAIARIFVDGEAWEIMGNVQDNFLPYTNEVNASRSGRIFATTESKARMLKVDTIKATPAEFPDVIAFFETC